MTALPSPVMVESRFSGLPPAGASAEGLALSLSPVPSLDRLELLWRDLESRADASFFTTWSWIGPWLAATADRPRALVCIRAGECVVGLAIVTPERRKEPWPRTALSLNGSGDAFYIEYNDILADRAWSGAVRRTLFAAAMDGGLGVCDDVEIAGAVPDLASAVMGLNLPVDSRSRACPLVDFAKCGKSLDGYLAALSRNTRAQVRRALRLAAGTAGLSLHRARTYAEKVTALNELRRLHQDTWRRRGLAGAFADPLFNTFISAILPMPGVELLHIGAGAHTVGVLLNFVHRGQVYAYQSGFAYAADNRFKPGLVCHTLAIADSMDLGRHGYHFMAGESRYKTQLATGTETLCWLTVRRPGPGTAVLQGLRGAREGLRGAREGLRGARSFARALVAGWP